MRCSRARIYVPFMAMLSSMRPPLLKSICRLWIVAGLVLPINGFAAETAHCLTGDEQRAAIASGKAMPLGSVIHALHRAPREVVKARLCQEPDRLIYLLTLLGRDGKVKLATVDAANGAVVGER